MPTSLPQTEIHARIVQAIDEVLNVFRGLTPPIVAQTFSGEVERNPRTLEIWYAFRSPEAVAAVRSKGMLEPIRRATLRALTSAGYPVESLPPGAIHFASKQEVQAAGVPLNYQ